MAYGWTDEQILDQIEYYGTDWFENAYRYVQEDKQEKFRWQMLVMPLAVSAGDQKSANALRNYSKSLEKALDAMTPWEQGSKRQGLVSDEMRKKIGSGNVAIMFDPGDATDLELWKDATVVKK